MLQAHQYSPCCVQLQFAEPNSHSSALETKHSQHRLCLSYSTICYQVVSLKHGRGHSSKMPFAFNSKQLGRCATVFVLSYVSLCVTSLDVELVQIATGVAHTCALLNDGTVKCWGYGQTGQLGYGDERTRGDGPGEMGNNLPIVSLGTGRTAVQIACGGYHTCALLDDASLKCWGYASGRSTWV